MDDNRFLNEVRVLPNQWILDDKGRIRCAGGERSLLSAVLEFTTELETEDDLDRVKRAAENLEGLDPTFRELLLDATVRKMKMAS